MTRKPRNRGGRPSKGPRDEFTVRPVKGTHLRLKALAKARGCSVSDLTAEMLERGVEQAEREEGLPNQETFDFKNLKTA